MRVLSGHISPRNAISPAAIEIWQIFPGRNPRTAAYRDGEGNWELQRGGIKGFLPPEEEEGK